ncbi:MAG: hypothetical protein RIS34_429 [Pseudomonadota bacterium]
MLNMVVPTASPRMSSLDAHGQARRYARILVSKVLDYFAQHEADQLKQLCACLLDLADNRPHVKQAQNWRAAASLLDRQAALFNQHYQLALRESMDAELGIALPDPHNTRSQQASNGDGLDGMSLSLIDIAEVEKILLLDRVSQRFSTHYETQLEPLVARLKVLFGSEPAASQHNPFRPQVFVRAFMQAWERSEFDEQATEDVMLALDPTHSMNWDALYADLVATLSQAGITPHHKARIRRATEPDSVTQSLQTLQPALEAAPAPPTPELADLDSESHRSGWGDLAASGRNMASQARQFLRNMGFPSSKPADLQTSREPPVFQQADPDLMGYLEGLQARPGPGVPHAFVEGQDPRNQNVLRHLRDRDEVRGAPELDRGTVDALAEVFDFVFADQTIPIQMKVVIGRLQIPVLKAAMIDRDFFLSSDHPARKLVDSLALASIAWAPERGEHDPLYVRIETTVKRILTEFEDDLTLFSELLMEFTEFLFETEQQAQAQIEPSAAQEQSDEAMDLALRHADEVIREHLAALPPDLPLASFLGPFLTGPWRQVMAHAWLKAPIDADRWARSCQTMDDLIWSTQAKISAAQRLQLVQVLPELVRHLNAGLDSIEWTGEDRAKFTKRLIATHMLAIRMTKPGQTESVPGALEDGSGHEALKVLDQRRERNMAGQADEFDAMAQSFTRGTWFDCVTDDQKRHHCRLTWVSPMRTRLLFTNREGFDAFVRSEREVAAMLRLGRLSAIDQSPVVARALSRIMSGGGSRHVG